MKPVAIFLYSVFIFLFIVCGGAILFTQESIIDITDLGSVVTFGNLEEYANTPDKLVDVQSFDWASIETHYKAIKNSETDLTISYYENAIQKQGVSKIPYRNKIDEELRYIDNNRYERPFTVLRYTLFSDISSNIKIKKKEIIDDEGNTKEYFEYKYNDDGLVEEFNKYALSPYKNEFQLYETAKFYYPESASGRESLLYYNVIDADGTIKFTYSASTTFANFTPGSDIEEIFIQYKPHVEKEKAALTKSVGSDELIINFDPSTIQFLIASAPTMDLIFNGDGSFRQAINR